MADSAHEWTDAQLLRIEKNLKKQYQQAYEEVTEKLNKYLEKNNQKIRDLYTEMISAPTAKERKAAKEAYEKAAMDFTLRSRRYLALQQEAAMRLANVNQLALDYINGELPPIYTLNYNYQDPEFMRLGISFNIVNEETIRNLIMEGDINLPFKDIDRMRDIKWNTKKMSSAILQGILQGESMDDIAKRLISVVDMNKKAAIRNARTMVTSAENRGRQDRYAKMEEQGIIMHKAWIATADGRTRDWHLSMDGQEVPYNGVFYDGLGQRLRYPADPYAPMNTIVNCRCTMRGVPVGVRGKNGRITYFQRDDYNGFHEQQIAQEEARRL